jgi:hypothetical protein
VVGRGLLFGSHATALLTAILTTNATRYTWVAATVGANEAAGYQLATGRPVMAIGGYNGTDPTPTLAQFLLLVQAGRVHYFIAASLGSILNGSPGGNLLSSSQIGTWVAQHFIAKPVDGVTLYDLSTPLA